MSIFTSEMIGRDTYVIRGEGCDAYLLTGDTEGIMIDSGMSAQNIRAYAEQLVYMPVRRVINTHSHFDHTAGNGFFDVIYGTPGIARSAKNTMGNDPAKYKLDYTFTLIQDGSTIDIGGRPLEIIVTDSHSPGSLAVLDVMGKQLFPGDDVESGQVLLLPGYAEEPGQIHARPACTVQSYLSAMQKLKALGGRYTRLCPAHNGTPLGTEVLDCYIELAQRILDGMEGDPDCGGRGYHAGMSHFPVAQANYRRAQWKGASLIYCADLIWDRDTANGQYEPATELHALSAASVYSPPT